MTIEEVVEASLRLMFNPFHAKQGKTKSVWDTDEYKVYRCFHITPEFEHMAKPLAKKYKLLPKITLTNSLNIIAP